MKLPFDLGVKLVFRLLLPGFFLMLGIRPILLSLLESSSGGKTYNDLALTVAILVLGWLITILDMPIYMAFEGRRFWPSVLLEHGIRREEARLRRWVDAERWNYDRFKAGGKAIHQRRYQEASVELRRFPVDENGRYTAMFPTRIGNLVTAFEQYPQTRYGADAIFYLPRLWVKLDKDLKEELDTQQAVADSAVYSSLALFITGVLWLAYAPMGRVGWLQYTATSKLALATGVGSILMSVVVYRAAIHVNDQFGNAFRAMFDMYLPGVAKEMLVCGPVLPQVAEITNDASVLRAPVRDKYKIVWRYLHNYRVRCPNCGSVMTPAEAVQHHCPTLDTDNAPLSPEP